jgi:hypothetical protein
MQSSTRAARRKADSTEEEEEERKDSEESKVNSSEPSVASAKVGLDIHTKTQLCEDIEANGGIASFIGTGHNLSTLLDRLCEEDPLRKTLYKERNHFVRKQIQKIVWVWQNHWNNGSYDRLVLSKFGVIAAQHREPQQQPTDKRKAVSSVEIQEEDPPVEAKFTRPKPIKSPPPKKKTEDPPKKNPPKKSEDREPFESRPPTASNNTESDLVKAFSRMTVDEQIYFVTPTSALGAFPPVDGRTCKCLPCLVFTLPIFAPS